MSSPCLCVHVFILRLFMSSSCLRVHVFILPLFMSSSCLRVHVFILPLLLCYLPAAPAYFYRFYGVFSWKARRSLACLAPMPRAGSPPPPFGGHPRLPGSRRGHRLLPLVFGWRQQQLSLGVRSVVPEQAQMFPDVPSLEAALGHSREKEGTSSALRVPLGLQRREKKGSASHGDLPGRPVTVGLVTRQMIRPVQWRSDQYSGGQTSTVEVRPVQWSSDQYSGVQTQYSGGQTSTVEFRPVQWSSDPVQWRSDPVQWSSDQYSGVQTQYSGGQTQYSGGTTSTVEVRPSTVEVRPSTVAGRPVQWRSDQYSGVQTSTVEFRPSTVEVRPVQWSSDQYSGVQTSTVEFRPSTVEVRPRPASFPLEELSPVPQTCGGPGPTHWFVGSSNAAAGAAGVCVYGGGRGWGHHETDPLNHFVVQKC
ncbi:ras-related protein Rab-4B isoform X20 [Gadus morhua]|uniref:ras-related protein Rab-4B isoform X20 n=1 Tax=Gadus morhua TaxID=8049 RepID=UPI0011B7EE9E|nr:uncharacterized protein LOC115528950 isoform X20 [Gadus morhua]